MEINAINNIEKAIVLGINHKATDIHIKSDRTTKVRVRCELKQTNVSSSADEIIAFCRQMMPLDQNKIDEFIERKRYSIDSTVSVFGRRLRLHLYRSNHDICLTLRLLSESIPPLETLYLPQSLEQFINKKSGLVLITGATGSGKTTTIASLVNEINKLRESFILTIEDPVEYLYREEKATIEQREVGHDVASFSQATIDALREDPDIIVVGEMRDLETIQNAITLAETGHLVFGTLHTKSVIETIDRVVDIFPASQQNQIRIQLASILNGIVHQQMINSDGNVVVLCEVLMMDNVLSGMLKNPNGYQQSGIRDHLRSMTNNGCVHIVDNVFWHIKHGRISPDSVQNILSQDDLKLLANRLSTIKRTSQQKQRQ